MADDDCVTDPSGRCTRWSHPHPEYREQTPGGRWAVSDAANRLLTALRDCVAQATDYGEQEGGFVAFYILPTGPIHRAIPLLQEFGITVRPHGHPTPPPGQDQGGAE